MVGHKGETSSVVGCKVLPICDVMSLSAGSNSGESSGDAGDCQQQIEGRKSEKRYGVTRMKELIRRAVAAKAQRVSAKACKVLNIPNRDVAKNSVDRDNRMSSSSSKISFMWDVRSCSSASSVVYTNRAEQLLVKNFSNLHLKSNGSDCSEPDQANKKSTSAVCAESIDCVRNGQWITNDTDFVVLEL